VFQPVLPLHECADPTADESTAEPLHSVADSAATEPLQSIADSVADFAAATAAPTETS
jgi:hypothetical protein